ncbi:MAG: hypothetical protein RLZZ47_420 [Bacteroidota bacterium]|jgi:hypothetical protein
MNAKHIELAVTRVLYKHECAVIPGFGAFILRKNYGMANPFSGQLKPSSHSIFFNTDITEDDGFVANELRETLGFNFKQAGELLADFRFQINAILANKSSVPFGELGNFHINPKGELFFLADANLNLSKESFGLPIISWEWKSTQNNIQKPENVASVQPLVSSPRPQEDTQEMVATIESPTLDTTNLVTSVDESQNNSDFTIAKRSQPLLWRAAASFAIISIGAGVLMTIAQIWSVSSGNDLASLLPQDSQVNQKQIVTKPKPIEVSVVKEPINQEEAQPIEHILNFGLGTTGIDSQYAALHAQPGKFIVSGGAYITNELAKRECLLWQKLGIDACVVSVKKSSLTKVILGRFEDEKSASKFAESIKNMPTGTLSVSDVALDWK